MSDSYFVNSQTYLDLKNTADAIRKKTGELNGLYINQFSDKIMGISGGGDGSIGGINYSYIDLNQLSIQTQIPDGDNRNSLAFRGSMGGTYDFMEITSSEIVNFPTFIYDNRRVISAPWSKNAYLFSAYDGRYYIYSEGTEPIQYANNLCNSFCYMNEITSIPSNILHNNIRNMYQTFYNCTNLNMPAWCGPNVENFSNTYCGCSNLYGEPQISNFIKNFDYAYFNCQNLSGNFIIPECTNSMNNTYYNCINLHCPSEGLYIPGTVISCIRAFGNCNDSLSGNIEIGPVYMANMNGLFANSSNNINNIIFKGYSTSPSYVTNMIYNHNGSKRINIWYNQTHCGSTFNNTSGSYSILGKAVTWAAMTNGYYNTTYNTYLYYNLPVNAQTALNPRIKDVSNTFNRWGGFLTGTPNISANVVNMFSTFYNCFNMTGSPASNVNVVDMYSAYYNCRNLTGTAACGPNVIDMSNAYALCMNLTKAYVGSNVKNMANTFRSCNNITSCTTLPDSVIDMSNAFYGCTLLTSVTCGENAANLRMTFNYCNSLTDVIVKNNVIDMYESLINCMNLVNFSGNLCNVTNLYRTFYNCCNLSNITIESLKSVRNGYYSFHNCTNALINLNFIYANNLLNGCSMFNDCFNLIGNPLITPNLINMSYMYNCCYNLTGEPYCSNSVLNMAFSYYNCQKLIGSPVCGDNVVNMAYAYFNCTSFDGDYVCGDNVTNMHSTYQHCHSFSNPVCGNNVTDMYSAYQNCWTYGEPVCGDNVILMNYAYYNCRNLTGSPIIGDKVTSMWNAYYYCVNLSGDVEIPRSVESMGYAFYRCNNITGIYINSLINSNASLSYSCFRDSRTSPRRNIVCNNYDTYLNIRANGYYIAGHTWSSDTTSTQYVVINGKSLRTVRYAYNATYNDYLYCMA